MTPVSSMPDVRLPVLHRVRDLWVVDGQPFGLGHWGSRGWTIVGFSVPARNWLADNGLSWQQFSARREALLTLTAHLAAADPPADEPIEPPLLRVRAGEYRTRDGQWTIGREDGMWLLDPEDGWEPCHHTLWQARAHITFLRAWKAQNQTQNGR